MKKMFIAALTLAMVLSVGTASVFAAGGYGRGQQAGGCHSGGNCSNISTSSRYADTNGDGICDYAGTNCRYVDANGDGICDYAGTNCRYVDADGDGVCDNFGQYTRPQDGMGYAHGCHGGRNR